MTKDQELKAQELKEKYGGCVWKYYCEETNTIYQWNGDEYVLEFNDKQLFQS